MNTHYKGRAGEYSVAAQLLLRGVPVYFPAVDSGVDLIAGENIRIQVKSSHLRTENRGYGFTLSARTPRVKRNEYTLKMRDWSKVDFVVFWGINENRFWVVPSSVLVEHRQVQTLLLGSSGKHWTVDQTKIREVVASGMSQRAAAEKLGVSEMSVSRAVNGVTPKTSASPCTVANLYEDAWHEIISAVGLIDQIDEVTHDVEGALK